MSGPKTQIQPVASYPEPLNAVSQGLPGPFPLHRPRSHARALGADLRAPARRLGRQYHQDRNAAASRRRRGTRRPARRLGLPEPSAQQTQHDARSEIAARSRGIQAAGRESRRGGGKFSPRREGPSRYRLRQPAQDQQAHHPRQHLRFRPGRALRQASGLRPDRARHGRADVHHRSAGRRSDARRASDRGSHGGIVLRARHHDGAARTRSLRRRSVGIDLAATGADLHARLPGRRAF